MKTITNSDAAHLIRNSGGRLFSVSFTKRSDGAARHMVARTGVRKGLTGAGASFSADDKGLLRVHEFVSLRDTQANPKPNLMAPIRCQTTQYRHIPIEGIQSLRIGGKLYRVA